MAWGTAEEPCIVQLAAFSHGHDMRFEVGFLQRAFGISQASKQDFAPVSVAVTT